MRTILRICTLLVVLGLGVAAGLGASSYGTSAPPDEDVLFEAALSRGPDPFTPPAIAEGTGPYGGTGDDGRCDQEALIGYLVAHPDRLRAWAEVQGIEPHEVPGYIRSLRPVILTEDTRVTNHGYRDGRAYAFQSTLQAGTAVLVDEDGKIVVRCRCGNPLREPECPDDCKPPKEECPEEWRRNADGECLPPDDECPDPLTPSAYDECRPPDDECPEDGVTIRHIECEPPDEECPEYPGTTTAVPLDPCEDDRRPEPTPRPQDPDRDPDPVRPDAGDDNEPVDDGDPGRDNGDLEEPEDPEEPEDEPQQGSFTTHRPTPQTAS